MLFDLPELRGQGIGGAVPGDGGEGELHVFRRQLTLAGVELNTLAKVELPGAPVVRDLPALREQGNELAGLGVAAQQVLVHRLGRGVPRPQHRDAAASVVAEGGDGHSSVPSGRDASPMVGAERHSAVVSRAVMKRRRLIIDRRDDAEGSSMTRGPDPVRGSRENPWAPLVRLGDTRSRAGVRLSYSKTVDFGRAVAAGPAELASSPVRPTRLATRAAARPGRPAWRGAG